MVRTLDMSCCARLAQRTELCYAEYKVCPFGQVTQREKAGHGTGSGAQVTLANWKRDAPGSGWVAGQYGTRLVMKGGMHCPPIGTGRRVELLFHCATEDRLLAVEEFETCVYVAELATPAACSTANIGGAAKALQLLPTTDRGLL